MLVYGDTEDPPQFWMSRAEMYSNLAAIKNLCLDQPTDNRHSEKASMYSNSVVLPQKLFIYIQCVYSAFLPILAIVCFQKRQEQSPICFNPNSNNFWNIVVCTLRCSTSPPYSIDCEPSFVSNPHHQPQPLECSMSPPHPLIVYQALCGSTCVC